MRSRGRSIWKNEKTGKWVCEARVPKLAGGYRKIQRTADTRKRAEELVDEVYLELRQRSTSEAPKLFKDLVANYIEIKSTHVLATTVAGNKYLLDKYLLPALGGRVLSKITSADVFGLLSRHHDSGLRAGSVNKLRAVLHSVFAVGVDHGYLEANPVRAVKPFRPKHEEVSQVEEPWTLEEARTALLAFSMSPLDSFVHLTVGYGLRKGEALGLRWADINFDHGYLEIQSNRGSRRSFDAEGHLVTRMTDGALKTKASRRRLQLTNLVMLSLMRERERLQIRGQIPDSNDFIVLGPSGKPLAEKSLYRIYNKTCEEHGLRRIRIHDHRHTAAVIALENEVDPIEASYGLGHSSFEITKRIYASRVPKLSIGFASKLGDALSGDATMPPGANVGGGVNV